MWDAIRQVALFETLDPKLSELPSDIKLFEKSLVDGRMYGAKSKTESNCARIARYNFIGPLLRQHPRYEKSIAEFVNGIVTTNDVNFWIATLGRSSVTEWQEFHKSYMQKKRPQAKVTISSQPLEKNWRKAVSAKYLKRWV